MEYKVRRASHKIDAFLWTPDPSSRRAPKLSALALFSSSHYFNSEIGTVSRDKCQNPR